MSRLRSIMIQAAGLLVALTTSVAAQTDYPTRPVRLIIPFPPGGSNDVVGRMIGTQLTEQLGKQVVVDNRAGAGGVVGTEIVSKAAPDGYTLGVISLAHAVNPWLYKLPYDPIKAFAPVGIMGTGPNVLVVHPSLPVKTTQELIALAKSKPGDLQYASAGIGSFQHLGSELFKLDRQGRYPARPVQGRRTGDDRRARRPHQDHVLLAGADHAAHQVRQAASRSAPAAASAAPCCRMCRPSAKACPATRPRTGGASLRRPERRPRSSSRLHDALSAAQNSEAVTKQFSSEGASVVRMSTEEFGKFMVSEMNKWERVVKEGGIKAQ